MFSLWLIFMLIGIGVYKIASFAKQNPGRTLECAQIIRKLLRR